MKIGSLIIRLAVETGVLKSGLSVAEKEVAKTTKAIQQRGREIADFGKKMSLGVSTPLLALAGTSIKAAIESKDAIAQVDASLKSMGNAAGRSREQLEGLATGMMRKSLYDDDEILRKVTANMLTFGNIAGEQFDRAQQAAVDMSTKLKKDLLSSTTMIGKALNDPVRGMSALNEAGIQFTDTQQNMIRSMVEAGDVAGAQKLMLAELEKQFKGSAEAARDADPMAAAKMSFAEFQETIGEKLLPLLPPLTDAITTVLDAFNSMSPAMQETVIIAGGLAVAFGPLLMALGSIVQIAAPTIALMKGMGLAFDFAGVLRNLIPLIGHLGKALLTLLMNPVILGAAVLIGGIFLAWKNWDKITAIVQRLYQGVKTWLFDKLGPIFEWVKGKIEMVERAFYWLADQVVFNSHIPDMVDLIGQHMGRLQALMVDPAVSAAKKTDEAFRDLAGRMSSLLDRLYPKVAALRAMQRDIADIDAWEAAGRVSPEEADEWRFRARGGGREMAVSDSVLNAPSLIKGMETIQTKLKGMANTTKVQTVRIAESFRDMAEKTMQSFRGLADAIKGGGFLDILEAGVNLFLQLGSSGVFGKGLAGKINAAPAYANGTSFHPGGMALVGEEGPELVSMPRGSKVFTNSETMGLLGGKLQVEVVANNNGFGAIVRNHAGQVVAEAAPGLMNGGAQISQQRAQFAQTRRLA